MRKYIFFFLVLTAMAVAACSGDLVYSRFQSVGSSDGSAFIAHQWHVDSIVRFDYHIADTAEDYQMLVYVRHDERYPYQNMWLFVGDSLRCDTIEFYLADDRGRWLGDKQHGFVEMAVLLEETMHFPDTGMYFLTVQQGMRDTLLRGVMDIGLEIKRNGKE